MGGQQTPAASPGYQPIELNMDPNFTATTSGINLPSNPSNVYDKPLPYNIPTPSYYNITGQN